MNATEFVIPQAVVLIDGKEQLVTPFRALPGLAYRCPECKQEVTFRRETRDERNRVTRSQHFAHKGESCGGPKKPPTAAERTGFPFNPGEEVGPQTVVLEDGPTLKVIRWKLLSERPCLVRCDHGETTIEAVRQLDTLCERSCAEAASVSARAPSAKEGYCMTCSSRAGKGVIR